MTLKYAIPVIMLTVFSVSHANADQRLTLGAKLLGAAWVSDNGTGGSDYESDEGGQLALNIAYKHDAFYTGLNLQRGKYTFKGDAPDKFTVAGRIPSSAVEIRQTDLDILFGYYFWPQVSLFIDIKAVNNNWLNDYYNQSFVGLGLGTSGFIPIDNRWTLFGSFGFIGKGDIKDNDKNKVGEGSSWALEIGTVYTIDEKHFLNAGVKTRRYNFEFLNGSTEEYSIRAIFIGYNYSFSL